MGPQMGPRCRQHLNNKHNFPNNSTSLEPEHAHTHTHTHKQHKNYLNNFRRNALLSGVGAAWSDGSPPNTCRLPIRIPNGFLMYALWIPCGFHIWPPHGSPYGLLGGFPMDCFASLAITQCHLNASFLEDAATTRRRCLQYIYIYIYIYIHSIYIYVYTHMHMYIYTHVHKPLYIHKNILTCESTLKRRFLARCADAHLTVVMLTLGFGSIFKPEETVFAF